MFMKSDILKKIVSYIDTHADEIIKIREKLHSNPELSLEEAETKKFILSNIIGKKDIRIVEFEDTFGFWVDVACSADKSYSGFVALRADMDALPIIEETGLPFCSKVNGKMHACGHDVHMTALLGALLAAIDNLDDIKKNANIGGLRFIFQASEEQSPGGAVKLIEKGVMDGVKMAFGLHVMPDIASGRAGIMEGPIMAAVDEFELELSGRGGHGAKPDASDDLILLASEIVVSAQKIISRNISPFVPAVLSFCTMHGGAASNVLPSRVNLSGTLRSLDEKTLAFLMARLEEILAAKCSEYGALYKIKFIKGYPVTVNDKAAMPFISRACVNVLGSENVLFEVQRSMGSEDFAYYAKKVPSAFVFFGSGEASGKSYPLHHPKFNVSDCDILNAARIFAAIIGEFIK